VPYLSASEVVFHEEALYQVYAPFTFTFTYYYCYYWVLTNWHIFPEITPAYAGPVRAPGL